jgi:DNA gyrase subunit A
MEYEYQRKGGKIAINLDEGDKLIFVGHTSGENHVLIGTRNGYAARFTEDQVRSMGRSAAGVRGISLRDGDLVAGACILERDEAWAAENKLITITEGGFGKRMEPSEFEAKGRGIMGVIAQKITDKTGALCGISVVKADEDIMMITNDGTIIRTPADGIPLYGRPAAGVIVMKLYDGAKLVNFALTEKEKEEDEAAPAAESDVIEGEAAEITDEAEAEEIPADAEEAENAESEPGTDE